MSDLDLTAAIEAGVQALHNNANHNGVEVPYCGGPAAHQEDDGEVAVRAAAPLIAAQVREQILAEMTLEWGVEHSQGLRREDNECSARASAISMAAADKSRRLAYRGKVRLVTRRVTEWEPTP